MDFKEFPEVKRNLGFGCMRLPMIETGGTGKDGKPEKVVDIEQFKEMVDFFLENGFNYFDTAHVYLNGLSEKAIKTALSSRYPRDRFILTDKLTGSCFNKEEEIRPLFAEQLEACGVDYFDFYLMHAQNAKNFEKFKACRAYETAFELKKEGKVHHVGLSFHDTPQVLDKILNEYPEIEIVQIQFNYYDYEDPSVQSRGVYEVARKHGKPLIIMEPVKGGNLVNLPPEAQKIFDELHGGSNASYAIRFAAGFDGMRMVLSGMSNMAQMRDNVSFMKDFKPLTETEQNAISRVVDIFRGMDLIPCTGCSYCIEENKCPMNIQIPDLFDCMNMKKAFGDANQDRFFNEYYTSGDKGKPSQCVECGGCESVCPQHLPIRDLLKKVAAEFEK
ncbi:MAG: aldo/keto reductase [Eubacterium sp.]|jgi:predicted aldo/keto reductase-like oxidoreductase